MVVHNTTHLHFVDVKMTAKVEKVWDNIPEDKTIALTIQSPYTTINLFLTEEQVKQVQKATSDYLITYHEPTINDLKRIIEESEANA